MLEIDKIISIQFEVNFKTHIHHRSILLFSLQGNSRLPDQEVEKLSTFMVEEFYLLNQLTF